MPPFPWRQRVKHFCDLPPSRSDGEWAALMGGKWMELVKDLTEPQGHEG